jgi:predicted GIY-YIG superfamily endonuclease
LAEEDEIWSYEVFGRFGLHAKDNGYDDTRKVNLVELLKNVDDESLELLEAFDKRVKKKVSAAKKALIENDENFDDEVAAPTSPADAAPTALDEAVAAAE